MVRRKKQQRKLVKAEPPRELTAAQLRRRCTGQGINVASTAEMPELEGIIGQERATRSIEFGLDIDSFGYNIYAMGPAGAGKTTTIIRYLQQKAKERPLPDDWAYVYNFKDPDSPRALRLPPGRGNEVKEDIQKLLHTISEELPQAYEGDQYSESRDRIVKDLEEERKKLVSEMEAYAKERNFALASTPMGIVIAPVKNGKPLKAEEYNALSEEERKQYEAAQADVQEKLDRTMRRINELGQIARDRLQELDQQIAGNTIQHLFRTLAEKYAAWPAIIEWLEEVRQDMVKNIALLRKVLAAKGKEDDNRPMPAVMPLRGTTLSPLQRYSVNVIVSHEGEAGVPVLLESNPTYQNLLGRQEHMAQMGMLMTNFTLLRGGALHRANGGYLVLDVQSVLRQPYAWDALKRALRLQEIRMEPLEQMLGLLSISGLTPEPIPLVVKVVLIGNPQLYYLLYAYDEDFQKLFKVRADFVPEMEWNAENVKQIASYIRMRCEEEKLPHFALEAVAVVIEYSSKQIGDQHKLTTRFAHVLDLVRESAYWAQKRGSDLVFAEDVQKAIAERIHRADYIEERLLEMTERDIFKIDISGAKVGQINGLAVLELGDYMFGRPSRITARTYLGQQGVINIEREAHLSGRIHDKGVLILSGYLGGKYAQNQPLSLAATLTFEQSYQGVDGDSASSTELYAILSSLSDLPLKQSIAVTGSVNQHGGIQAIGGVTEKIEGFFKLCQKKGLTGDQGVMIPESNVQHLMLNQEIVDAVEQGRFHIYPVRTVDEGIAILTGVAAGERQESGRFPAGTVNALVESRLRQMALRLRSFGRPTQRTKEKEVLVAPAEPENPPPEPPKTPPDERGDI